jgi:hypothetical protein
VTRQRGKKDVTASGGNGLPLVGCCKRCDGIRRSPKNASAPPALNRWGRGEGTRQRGKRDVTASGGNGLPWVGCCKRCDDIRRSPKNASGPRASNPWSGKEETQGKGKTLWAPPGLGGSLLVGRCHRVTRTGRLLTLPFLLRAPDPPRGQTGSGATPPEAWEKKGRKKGEGTLPRRPPDPGRNVLPRNAAG